ncbi:hypothetical protein HDR58_08665 [bacterium]|nr:hypothetical protein [bacterium]
MKFLSREAIKNIEKTIQKSYNLPIFKGYKAINKRGLEKLIDELYAHLPEDVEKAREYLRTRNYEIKTNPKKNTLYETIQKLEIKLNEGFPLFAQTIILNIKDLENLLKEIENDIPEEILKAEILSK